jgi:hypothetical protein
MTASAAHRYVGGRWRARFLRAPASAIELVDRQDFVALGDIAEFSLGLKTGSDKFFLVKIPASPRASVLGVAGSRRTVGVRSRIGWEGEITAADLRPLLLNPHRLQDGENRALVVPDRMDDAYLYPRDRPPRGGLADYIAAGEREGIHTGALVQSNATGNRWYRGRAPVDWRWALPYSSAYDYAAHDNAAHRVLNGRFVGCRPTPDEHGELVDEELLGAVLNSTFVILTRLLEGVATGSEAAFDVGPPAARLMRIPDPRRMTDPDKAETVIEALGACRQIDVIPAAPDRHGEVSHLRRDLDTAILIALGATAGEAAHQLDVIYRSYARWRAAVEDVEARVRENRRALAGAGRGRTESPVDLVARQIWDELSVEAPLLPSAELAADTTVEQVAIAHGFRAPNHQPMFDAGHVRAPNGQTTDLGSWDRVRYAAMLLRLGFQSPLAIPVDADAARAVADAYDATRARLEREALRLGTQNIGSVRAREVADEVLRMWRHACHEAGMSVA